jgi:hypothetical protein
MTSHYPLPRANQECWTKWYNRTITHGALKNKTILWVAQELPCRFKSEQVKDIIGPHHVFILKLNDKFSYGVIDETETMYRLPKKYYTACFPGIQYSQVPKNNRCKVKLSGRRTIELPYIPESFLEQKKTKTSRKRRRSDVKSSDIEDLDFSVTTPEWTVLGEKKESEGNKDDIFHLIRSVIAYSDKNENFDLKNDFENITVEQIQNSDELREKMKTVISFIYYYCRGELGFFQERPPISISDLQSWLSALNS